MYKLMWLKQTMNIHKDLFLGGEGGGRGDRDGEDMWTQGLFISMYDKIHYK